MQTHRLHIKIAELNTHSDGNGITGIPRLMQFFKRRKNLRTRRSCTLSHFSNANFEKFLMTAKASKLHN